MSRAVIVGCGYVGAALAELLAARGHEVWGMRRTPSPSRHGVRFIAADVLRPDSLIWPEPVDAVVYAVSADASTEAAYHAAYVRGLDNVLLSLGRQSLAPRIIFVSSTGVYHQDDGSWLDEESPAEPRGFSGRLLLEGEAVLRDSGLQGSVVRLSGIYGPNRERLIESVKSGAARRIRGGTAVLNHIHRDDCAGVLAHVLALPQAAPVYLGTDCEPAYKNLVFSWIAGQLRLPEPPEIDAPPPTGIHRGGHRFYSNKRLLDSGYVFRYPSYREGYQALLGLPHDRPIA